MRNHVQMVFSRLLRPIRYSLDVLVVRNLAVRPLSCGLRRSMSAFKTCHSKSCPAIRSEKRPYAASTAAAAAQRFSIWMCLKRRHGSTFPSASKVFRGFLRFSTRTQILSTLNSMNRKFLRSSMPHSSEGYDWSPCRPIGNKLSRT